jgi:hypothetical protein
MAETPKWFQLSWDDWVTWVRKGIHQGGPMTNTSTSDPTPSERPVETTEQETQTETTETTRTTRAGAAADAEVEDTDDPEQE